MPRDVRESREKTREVGKRAAAARARAGVASAKDTSSFVHTRRPHVHPHTSTAESSLPASAKCDCHRAAAAFCQLAGVVFGLSRRASGVASRNRPGSGVKNRASSSFVPSAAACSSRSRVASSRIPNTPTVASIAAPPKTRSTAEDRDAEKGDGVLDARVSVSRAPSDASTGSRVASAAAATREKARDVSERKTAKATSVLATLVAETRRFGDVSETGRVVARKRADDAVDAKERESEQKRESEARAIEAEILAAGRAAATLKALVCANAFNRDAARALGAMAPLVAMVASVGSSTSSRLESSALHEARIRAATDAAGALRNLAYANATNRAAAIEAGALDALNAVLRGAPPEAAPDGLQKRLAFASASALENLRPRGRDATR